MNKDDIKMTSKHKRNLVMRFVIVLLAVVLVSYLFKIFGSDIFNKFITNETFINVSNFIDTHYLLNIFVYGCLGYVLTLFFTLMCCGKLRIKWYEYLILFAVSFGMAFLRDTYIGTITYLFDLIQYVLLPIVYGSITRKTNAVNNLLNCLIMYFSHCGIMIYNMTLCDLIGLQYGSNLVAYILCYIEIYLFIVAISIYIINGGYRNGKSFISSIRKERPNDRIQED